MDVREKLVELLKTLPTRNGYTDLEDIADHLIANGVTVHEDCKECAEATQNCIVKLQKQIAELRSVQEWIPVTQRLPECGKRVLATDGGFVGEFYINKRGQWQRYNVNDSSLLMALDILFWMPLPEPPKEDA